MMCQYVKVLKNKTFTILDDHLSQRTLTTCLKETQSLHPTEISSKEIITMRAKMGMVTGTAISRNQTLTVARKMAMDQETVDLPTTKGTAIFRVEADFAWQLHYNIQIYITKYFSINFRESIC